ncbi:MAG: glycosyltransferase [Chthoniobacteraceae bacterium]
MFKPGYFIIQRLVLPDFRSISPLEMYTRDVGESCIFRLKDQTILLDKGSQVTFDTYFNALSVKVWKQHTQIRDLTLFLSGRGRFLLRFGLHRFGNPQRWLSEQEITLGETETHVDLEFWDKLESGLLYFSLIALEDDSVFTGGSYGTRTQPECEAHLGVVITHYNRREFVLPAIERLKRELLADPLFHDRIELIVVDNSRTILPHEAEGITLIPSRNLGGSGGFMRGLLHLEDAGRFTHCLFMDDDASCETESIRRSYALLSYARNPKLAIAGTLLRELEPYRLVETGGRLDKIVHPINPDLDVRDLDDLLKAESSGKSANYGAWWFFGFKLSEVCVYAFPFFVRGDDIAFSVMNRFEICILNGVGCHGSDFAYKCGPTTHYLDARSRLVLQIALSPLEKGKLCKSIHRFFKEQIYSYCYASAATISLALEHVAKGPRFWSENIDMGNLFPQLATMGSSEKLVPLDRSKYRLKRFKGKHRRINTFLRKITLNGFLLPSCFFKNRVLFQEKGFTGNALAIFRYSKVYYEYEPLQCGFIAVHSKKRYFKEYLLFLRRLYHFRRNFDKIQEEYRKALPELTSRHFWEKNLSA